MIFSSIDDFYEKLIEDYKSRAFTDDEEARVKSETKKHGAYDDRGITFSEERVRESFLYRYLEEKKSAEALRVSGDIAEWRGFTGSPKDTRQLKEKDKYVLLRGARLAFENKIISSEEYREIFLIANKASKSGKAGRIKLFDTKPDKAQAQLEFRLLKDCADRFVDNAQRRKTTNGAVYIDVVNMLYRYNKECEKSGEAPASAARSELSAEYIQKCDALYRTFEKDGSKYRDIFIPLHIDSDVGAGVYIVGGHYIKSDKPMPCVLSFDMVDLVKSDGRDLNSDEPYISVSMKYAVYTTVDKAFDRLEAGLTNGDFFENISLDNGELPKDVDECFGSRFEKAEGYNEALRQELRKENAGIAKMREDDMNGDL